MTAAKKPVRWKRDDHGYVGVPDCGATLGADRDKDRTWTARYWRGSLCTNGREVAAVYDLPTMFLARWEAERLHKKHCKVCK